MDNTQKIPNHVAIIPDGNRRWARTQGVEPWDGHAAGADVIEELAKKARDMGVKYISFWGSSEENMKRRSLRERRELVKIYEKYFNKLISSDDIIDDEVCINVLGKWREQLPKKLVSIIEEGVEKTKNHKKHYLTFFLSYSGDEEMVDAIEKIAKSYEKGVRITKEVIKKHLLTKDLPVVDYLIRTGGEPHLSAGFMMWDIANTQLFFSDEYFPDFGSEKFEEAIEEYVRRTRRLGA